MPCWTKMASVGIFILFLIIEEKLSAFYQWVWCSTEKAMAPHSSTLAWKIPWTEDPGRLQSMGSLRVRHDWATSLSLSTFMHWRRKWQPTPVFVPGESQGQGSLMGCCLWGCTVGHDWSDLAAAAAPEFHPLSWSLRCYYWSKKKWCYWSVFGSSL